MMAGYCQRQLGLTENHIKSSNSQYNDSRDIDIRSCGFFEI